MATILEIRCGLPKDPDFFNEMLGSARTWPETHDSGYRKEIVSGYASLCYNGIEGDGAGYPTHISDRQNRGILVFNELIYESLQLEEFLSNTHTLTRGGFAENFVVNDVSLLPSAVCIGDIFKVGTALVRVSGPRMPCPKVDAWHGVKGLTKLTMQRGWAGYFLKVLEEGECRVGDEFIRVAQPHPGYTIERIAGGIWGPEEVKDNSVQFLRYVANMNELIERHFKDTAKLRLDRVLHDAENYS